MKKLLILTALLCSGIYCFSAVETFKHVKIHRHRSPEKRVLVDKVGVLTFDDEHRRLTFLRDVQDKFEFQDKVEADYDHITKVVFEVTSHMRAGALAVVAGLTPLAGGLVGPAIAGQYVNDYWFYLEYKEGDEIEKVLFEVPKDCSDRVINKATELFGSRVAIADFPEKGEAVDIEKLADRKSKHELHIDKKNRSFPEPNPDKATILVVCPPLAARNTGLGNQYKLHANDQVVLVNKSGTYSFAYLDPGKYHLISQSENANGFEMELEAGKTYYFLQNTFQGVFKGHTMLSRHSPELTLYLADGAYFADWKRK